MIIDIHTHTFPPKIVKVAMEKLSGDSHVAPSADGTAEGLLSSMDAAGIDKSVLLSVATNTAQVPKLNDIAISNADNTDRFITFGCMHPDYEDYEQELCRIAEAGVRGIKTHPVYQNTRISDEKYIRIFKVCARLGLIVLTHAGMDMGFPGVDICGPEESRKVIDAVPDLKLVLAHMGAWIQWDNVVSCLKDTPVYVDTAFSIGRANRIPGEGEGFEDINLLEPGRFVSIIEALGPKRVLFGTDSPWTDQYTTVKNIMALDIPDNHKKLILGENAAGLLGIGI